MTTTPGPGRVRALLRAAVLRGDAPRLFEELQRRYGDVVRVGRFHLLFHPDHVKDVLETSADRFQRVPSERRMSARIAGGSLFSIEGQSHARRRAAIEPVMYQRAPDAMAAEVARLAAWMRDTLSEGKEMDLFAWAEEMTSRQMVALLFGYEPDSQENRELSGLIRRTIDAMDRLFLGPSTLPDRLPLLSARFRHSLSELDRTLTSAIDRQTGAAGVEHPTLVLLLAEAGLSNGELRDEVMALFRGHQAVSSALAWTLYQVAGLPHVEERLQGEIDSVMPGRGPGPEDLPNLDYTRRVVQESLRLLPPAWVLARTCVADHPVDGHTVPAGSRVLLSQWVTHRDPRFWKDPLRFDPDRFTVQAAKRRPDYAYFPQGGGDKMCVGKHFVIPVEAPLIVAAVAGRWRMRLTPGFRVQLAPRATLKPRRGIRVVVERRSRSGREAL